MSATTSSPRALPSERLDHPSVDQRDGSALLWLTNISHAVNHFQNQMVAILYPAIMAELGFGYGQLGVLTAIQSLLSSAAQVIYGFLVPFFSRGKLLGIGNVLIGLGTALTGAVSSFNALVGARAVVAVGNSAQHPVGSSLLAAHYPRKVGTVLALNNSLANVGSLVAPTVAGLLLIAFGWRQVFVLVALASLAVGVAYFFFRERAGSRRHPPGSRKARLTQGKASYLRVLRNRNMLVISLIMMIGAAGRDGGVNQTYLGPHLMNDLALSIGLAGLALTVLQIGSIVGPLGLGWLSDRISRRWVLQVSLLLSAFTTWWLAHQDAYLPLLLLNLIIYGCVSYSRGTLTQALVADSLSDGDRDAAFSLYYFIGFISGPFWALLTGYLMERTGFSLAFSVLGFSYLGGMLLLFLVRDAHSTKMTRATVSKL